MSGTQKPAETRKPFREPQLRVYGSIASVTNAQRVRSRISDGVTGRGNPMRTAA